MKKLYGIVCANITPMYENGEIDLISLEKLIDNMASNGIHGVYPCGTNGEGISLLLKEHHAVTDKVIQHNAGRMSAYIQCATVHWEDTMANIQYACERGADGVGVMTPIFYKADDTAMVEYYHEASATASGKPLYIYNISKYTNNDVSVKAFAQIIDDCPNIMGIKYSAQDIQRIQDYMRAPKTRKPDVLIGADSLICSALASGCIGEVSGPACVFPKWYVKCYEAFINGQMDLALEMQNKIVNCSRSIKPVPQIPAIKAMLKMKGIIENDTCRKPFRQLTIEEYRILEKAVDLYEMDN